jgi:hypothetical protein
MFLMVLQAFGCGGGGQMLEKRFWVSKVDEKNSLLRLLVYQV